MESNPIRMYELLVGLPAVKVLGIENEDSDRLHVHVERVAERDGCPQCGVVAAGEAKRVNFSSLVMTRLAGPQDQYCLAQQRFAQAKPPCRSSLLSLVFSHLSRPKELNCPGVYLTRG